MKKMLSLMLALLMLAGMTACGGNETEDTDGGEGGELPKVNFWATGSQNVSDAFTAAIEAYNAQEDRAADVELQFVLSGSGDATLSSRLAAAYISGQSDTGFDIIAENGSSLVSYVDEAGSEDLFLDIDTSKLSNYGNVQLTPSVLSDKLVPYRGTTVVFAYDSAKLPDPPQTWDELTEWIKANDGRFAYNTPDSGGAGSGFVYNAIYRFIDDPEARMSNDPKYAEMYDEGFAWLTEIHPYIYKSGGHVQYPVKNQGALDLLGSGEVWLVPAYADGTLSAMQAGTLPDTVKMYQLSDGALTGSDVDIAIPSIGSNVDACYDVVDFMLSPEGQQIFVDTMYAVPVIDASMLEQTPAVEAVSSLNPSDFSFMSIGDLGSTIKERWTEEIATLG